MARRAELIPRISGLRPALVECVREHPIDDPVPGLARFVSRHGVRPLHLAAVRHGVVGCLWTALRATGLADRTDAAPVREAYTSAVGRHLRTLSDLELVLDVLGGYSIAPLVVKGPVLAGAVYRRPDLRGYVDLDVLVAPAEFPVALPALERAGCEVFERNWPLVRDRRLGALRLTTPAGTVLDLHWHPFYERSVRAAVPVDVGAVRARARTVELAGRRVRTFDALDTLVHLAVHAALDGGDRLVWCKDIEQALLYRAVPDWDQLAARAAQWHAAPAVALMLGRARRWLGAPVPLPVLRALAPDPWWRALVRLCDLAAPALPGRPSPTRAVARAARADGPASRRELLRRLTHSLRGRTRERFDALDPESAAYPAGGVVERRAYLEEVRRAR
jgi:putative nucleotidyltransferase-like protein